MNADLEMAIKLLTEAVESDSGLESLSPAETEAVLGAIQHGVGRCATCRWWRSPNVVGEHGQCLLVSDNADGRYSDAVSVDADGDGWGIDSVTLSPKATFGCILHEPKEANDEE